MPSYPIDGRKIQDLSERIFDCLSKAISINTVAFRSAGVKYANEADLISGHGAAYYGGRWNPPRIRAIYASLELNTAVSESYQEFLKFGFSPRSIRPRVIAGLKLELKTVLDLTDTHLCRSLGLKASELILEAWDTIQETGHESLTQAIGRAAYHAGFEGLLVPSAREKGGINIVVFPDKLARSSRVEILEKDDLPPHPSEWPL